MGSNLIIINHFRLYWDNPFMSGKSGELRTPIPVMAECITSCRVWVGWSRDQTMQLKLLCVGWVE